MQSNAKQSDRKAKQNKAMKTKQSCFVHSLGKQQVLLDSLSLFLFHLLHICPGLNSESPLLPLHKQKYITNQGRAGFIQNTGPPEATLHPDARLSKTRCIEKQSIYIYIYIHISKPTNLTLEPQ